MKRHLTHLLSFLLCLILCLSLLSCASEPPETVNGIAFSVLGNPAQAAFPEDGVARCPWDMILYGDTLYLGSGDYDKNAGPVPVFSYDTKKGVWHTGEMLPEEEINRFISLDGTLSFTGVDPKEDWSFGNYYTLEDGVWVKNRTLPDGIHNFDLVSYGGMLFAALGVAAGKYPVVCSRDGGEHFEEIVFERDGAPVDTSVYQTIRTHDLILFEDTLYALFTYGDGKLSHDLYRYDGENGIFLFDNEWGSKLTRIKFNHMQITAKESVNDALYLATGRLYATTDMQALTDITPEGVRLACDLYRDGRDLYALCASKDEESGRFKTSVYKLWDGDTPFFTELFNFLYDVPPISLAVCDDLFYIGMGNTVTASDKNGNVLLVEYDS